MEAAFEVAVPHALFIWTRYLRPFKTLVAPVIT